MSHPGEMISDDAIAEPQAQVDYNRRRLRDASNGTFGPGDDEKRASRPTDIQLESSAIDCPDVGVTNISTELTRPVDQTPKEGAMGDPRKADTGRETVARPWAGASSRTTQAPLASPLPPSATLTSTRPSIPRLHVTHPSISSSPPSTSRLHNVAVAPIALEEKTNTKRREVQRSALAHRVSEEVVLENTQNITQLAGERPSAEIRINDVLIDRRSS